jgi:hypothetical protein
MSEEEQLIAVQILRDTFAFLAGLERAGKTWGFRPPHLEEWPDEYAENLGDHIMAKLELPLPLRRQKQ